MLVDPLTRRELSGMARRWTTFATRMAAGLGMAWAVWELWVQIERGHAYFGGRSYGPSEIASVGRQMFLVYFAGLMIGLPLVAVSAAADLVPKEVRNGTLGLLFLTPLTPWRIAAGKWKAAMAQAGLLLLSGGPITAIAVYLGGVEAWDLLWSTALPLVSAGFAAALALFVSTLVRTSAVTMVAAILLLIAGIFLPAWILFDNGSGLAIDLLGRTHPVFAAMVVAEPRRVDPDLVRYGWMQATAAAAFATALVLRAAAARLPGRLLVQFGPSLLSRLMARLDGFFERIDARRVRWLTPSNVVWESRVLLWKELRTRAAGKLRYSVRLALVLLVFAALALSVRTGGMQIYGEFIWAVACLLWLQAVVGGVSLFLQEKEARQWDILLSTPLSVRQILASKLAGGLVPLAPTAVVGFLYLCTVAAVSPRGGMVFLAAAAPAAVFAVFAYLVAAAASLRCATQRGAFGLALGILAVVLLGIPGFANAVLDFPHEERQQLLAWTNPAWYLGWAGDHLRWGYVRYYYSSTGFPEPLDRLPIFASAYAVAVVLLLVWMRRRFDRLSGRAG